MSYKNTDLPDETIINLSFSLKQIKLLDHAVQSLLADVEQGVSDRPAKPLQTLIDVFWVILKVPMTDDEQVQAMRDWQRKVAENQLLFLDAEETKRELSGLVVHP